MDTSSETSEADPPKKRKIAVKAEAVNLYKYNYLKYGFTYVGNENKPCPKCLSCKAEFDNTHMTAATLKKHFIREHSELANKIIRDYFINLKNGETKEAESSNATNNNVSNNNVTNNYVVNLEVANHKVTKNKVANGEVVNSKWVKLICNNMQQMDIHKAFQYLILPACEEVKSTSQYDSGSTIPNAPISQDNISAYIKKMPSDIRQQLKNKLCGAKFSLLLDIRHKCYLLSYVRYMNEDSIKEHFLSYIELESTDAEPDIYNHMKKSLKTNGLQLEDCVSIFVASMVRNENESFVKYLKKELSNKTIRCWYGRDILIERPLSEFLKEVMKKVEDMIRTVICNPVGREVSEIMYQIMGSRYKLLLLCNNHWMFRSQALRKLYDQKEALLRIFNKTKSDFAMFVENQVWLSAFAYLADISQRVIDLSESMQDGESYIFTSIDKVKGFLKKIERWEENIKSNNFEMFQLAAKTDPKCIASHILEHLSAMKNELHGYFLRANTDEYIWVRNPFACTNAEGRHLAQQKKDMLNDMSMNVDYQLKYREKKSLLKFWISANDAYPELAEDALSILLQFSSSEMLEQGRYALHTVTFHREERLLSIENELLLRLSTIRPQIQRQIIIDDQSTSCKILYTISLFLLY